MSRIARYRTGYLLVLGALSALTYTVVRAAGGSSAALLTVGFLLLVPGRLQGLLLRPLFRGQRALAEGKPEEAAVQFHHQLTQLQAQPWRRLALWLGWSPYTPSLAAMVTNNLGVAYAARGELEQAQAAWKHALALDHLYPVPYANLANLALGVPTITRVPLALNKHLNTLMRFLEMASTKHRLSYGKIRTLLATQVA